MILKDLSLAGLAGTSGPVQISLQPGYNALCVSAALSSSLIAALRELLFSTTTELSPASSAAVGATLSRAAGTLSCSAESAFRVARDFAKGTAQLSEYSPETRDFRSVSADAAEIVMMLRSHAGLPSKGLFEACFVISRSALPSVAASRGPAPSTGPAPISAAERRAIEQRLAALEERSTAAESAAATEAELAGLRRRERETGAELNTKQLSGVVADTTDQQVDSRWRLDVLGDDFERRYADYRERKRRRDNDLARHDKERTRLERLSRTASPKRVLLDWRVAGAAGLSAASLLFAAIAGGAARYAALLDIPALGLCAGTLWVYLFRREEQEEAGRQLGQMAGQREEILARDQTQMAAVEALLAEAHLQSDSDVMAALGAKQKARENIARQANDPEINRLQDEKQKIEQAIADLERRRAEQTAVSASVASLREEAAALRSQLQTALSKPEAPVQRPRQDESGPFFATLLAQAQDVLLVDSASCARLLSEQATKIVAVLTQNRLRAVDLDFQGEVQMHGADGLATPWASVPAPARDVAYLALRAALLLSLDEGSRVPVVCEDISDAVPGGAALVNTLLAEIAKLNQVLHLVAQPGNAMPDSAATTLEGRR